MFIFKWIRMTRTIKYFIYFLNIYIFYTPAIKKSIIYQTSYIHSLFQQLFMQPLCFQILQIHNLMCD